MQGCEKKTGAPTCNVQNGVFTFVYLAGVRNSMVAAWPVVRCVSSTRKGVYITADDGQLPDLKARLEMT